MPNSFRHLPEPAGLFKKCSIFVFIDSISKMKEMLKRVRHENTVVPYWIIEIGIKSCVKETVP